MCVAYPGTVIATKEEGRKVTVDFSGTVVDAMTGFMPVKVGDRVLVHAGCVLQVLTEDDAKAIEQIFSDIAEIEGKGKLYQDDLEGYTPQDSAGNQYGHE